MQFGPDDIEILAKDNVFDGFLKLARFRFRFRRHQGGWSEEFTRHILTMPHAVAILLHDPKEDKLVFVEQLRLGALYGGIPPWQLEIPAGFMDPDDSAPEATAIREAKEETGFDIADLQKIHSFIASPGTSSEIAHIFYATIDLRKMESAFHGLQEEAEDIKLVIMTRAEALAALAAGKFYHPAALIALQWLQLKG